MLESIYRWAKPVLAIGLWGVGLVRCPCGDESAWALGGAAGTALYILLARTTPVLRVSLLASRATWAMLLRAAADDVLWRGWLSSPLVRPAQPYAAVLSIAGFALTHLPRQRSRGLATHLVTGALFTAVMISSGLLAAIIAHGIYNLLVLMARTAADRTAEQEGQDAA